MVRTQIQLTEEQAEALRKAAAKQRVSSAEVIRRSLELYLSQLNQVSDDRLREQAREIVGMFASKKSDISSNHDQYLDEAFGS